MRVILISRTVGRPENNGAGVLQMSASKWQGGRIEMRGDSTCETGGRPGFTV
ncbi:MAG: hypothetical protein ABSH09_27595 [Bryobacteraceae bacterium]